MKASSKTLFILGILAIAASIAAAAFAQMRPIHPGTTDILQTQQIQALRLEVARLQVQLVACHEEVDSLKEQLGACRGKAVSPVGEKVTNTEPENESTTGKGSDEKAE